MREKFVIAGAAALKLANALELTNKLEPLKSRTLSALFDANLVTADTFVVVRTNKSTFAFRVRAALFANALERCRLSF